MTARHLATVLLLALAANASIAVAVALLSGHSVERTVTDGSRRPRPVEFRWLPPPKERRTDEPVRVASDPPCEAGAPPARSSPPPRRVKPLPLAPEPRVPDTLLAQTARGPQVRLATGSEMESLALATLPMTIAPVVATNAGPMDARGVEVPPRKLSCPQPDYPRFLRQRGVQGVVRVRLLVGRRGRVRQVKIVHANPPGGFERAVEHAVRRWLFQPARHRGRIVACWCNQDFEFSMEGQ